MSSGAVLKAIRGCDRHNIDSKKVASAVRDLYRSCGDAFPASLRDEVHPWEMVKCVESLSRATALTEPRLLETVQNGAKHILNRSHHHAAYPQAAHLLRSFSLSSVPANTLLRARLFSQTPPTQIAIAVHIDLLISLLSLEARQLSQTRLLSPLLHYVGEEIGGGVVLEGRERVRLVSLVKAATFFEKRVEKVGIKGLRRECLRQLVANIGVVSMQECMGVLECLNLTDDRAIIDIFYKSAAGRIANCSSTQKATFLETSARLKRSPDPKITTSLLSDYKALITSDPDVAVSILHSLTKNKDPKARSVFSLISEGERVNVNVLSVKSLVNLIWSQAHLKVRDKAFAEQVAEQFGSPGVAMEMVPIQAANVLWGFATLGIRPASAAVIEAAISTTQTVRTMDPIAACRIAWAAVTLKLSNRFLKQFISIHITNSSTLLTNANSSDEITILWALVKAKVVKLDSKFEQILKNCASKVITRNDRDRTHIPKLLWVYSTLRCADRPTLHRIGGYIAKGVGEMSVDHMAMNGRALASIGGLWGNPFFAEILEATVKEGARWRISADVACQLLWVTSSLRTNHPRERLQQAGEILGRHLRPHLKALTEAQLLGAVRSFARLHVALPRGAIDQTLKLIPHCNLESHASTLTALSTLSCAGRYVNGLQEMASQCGNAEQKKKIAILEVVKKFS